MTSLPKSMWWHGPVGVVGIKRGPKAVIGDAILLGQREKYGCSSKPTAWEMLHRLIRVLQDKGQEATAKSMRQLPEQGKIITNLARRLNSICERKKWKEEAKPYKELIAAWHCMIYNEEGATEPSPSD